MANPFDEVCKATFQYHNDRIKQVQQWRNWSIAGYITFTGFVYHALGGFLALSPSRSDVSPIFYIALTLHLIIGAISVLLIRLLALHLGDRCDRAESLLNAWRDEVAKKENSEVNSPSLMNLWLKYETPFATRVSSAQSWFFLALIFGDVFLIMLPFESQFLNCMCWVVTTVAVALLFVLAISRLTDYMVRIKIQGHRA